MFVLNGLVSFKKQNFLVGACITINKFQRMLYSGLLDCFIQLWASQQKYLIIENFVQKPVFLLFFRALNCSLNVSCANVCNILQSSVSKPSDCAKFWGKLAFSAIFQQFCCCENQDYTYKGYCQSGVNFSCIMLFLDI